MKNRCFVLTVCAAVAAALLASCASRSLLTESKDDEFYSGVMTYDIKPRETNPRFIVYGDTQAGWRAQQSFSKSSLLTKKQFILGYYQLRLIGGGLVGGVNWMRHKPDYGVSERRQVRDAVFGEVQRSAPDFVLHLGDICLADGRRSGHWEAFIQENKYDVPLLTKVPYVTIIGNHEVANDEQYGFANYNAVFGYPRFYVLDFPDMALFVLDSNFILDQNELIDDGTQDALFEKWFVSSPESTNRGWLERELARREQKFKVVAMHHPPFSVGKHFKDWEEDAWGNDLGAKRNRLIDALIAGGVQIVLSGHEHNYQHIEVRKEGQAGKALHVIVSSGGGAPIRGLGSREELEQKCGAFGVDGLDVTLTNYGEMHHYSTVSVGPDSLTIETTGVEAEQGRPGYVVERVTLTAP